VAEKPAGAPATSKPAPSKPATREPAGPAAAGLATGGEAVSPPTSGAPQPGSVITPTNDGPYALQLGSFSGEANAQKVRDQYLRLGYPVHVRAASTSDGAIVYRVWVGFFASRQEAQSYARAHAPELADAIAVHR
jgi:cell division septation protein DedD